MLLFSDDGRLSGAADYGARLAGCFRLRVVIEYSHSMAADV